MVNGIRANDLRCGLNQECGLKLCVDSRDGPETPEDGQRTHRLKLCEYSDKDNSPKTMNNKNGLCLFLMANKPIMVIYCQNMHAHTHTHIYIKVVTFVERDPKVLFSTATTPRSRGGRYYIPWIAPLYPWSVPYNISHRLIGSDLYNHPSCAVKIRVLRVTWSFWLPGYGLLCHLDPVLKH